MRRRTVVLVAGLLALLLAAPAANAASRGGGTVLEFDGMVGVAEPFTGATNAIRGVPGGGLPWDIRSAKGELRGDGRLEIDVRGLVLARRAPVPPERQGTNPSTSFMAIVSCVTSQDGVATTVNVSSKLAPATARGDSKIRDTVQLPSPCLAPIVFVASPAGAWFAATGS